MQATSLDKTAEGLLLGTGHLGSRRQLDLGDAETAFDLFDVNPHLVAMRVGVKPDR